MIASLLNKASRIAIMLGATCMLAAPSAYGQDEQDDTERQPQQLQQPEQPVSTQDEDGSVKAKELDKAKGRFFLGGRPVLKRQVGPAIGKPKSILPQPFVPKGSVKVPDAPISLASEENIAQDGTPVVEGSVEPVQAETTVDTEQNGQAVYVPADDFSEASLTLFDPSGMAVSNSGAVFEQGFWQGYDRVSYRARLKDFENVAGSPALVSIANKIVLSAIEFAPLEREEEISALIAARLNLLQKLGNDKGYKDLLAALPAGRDWSSLARYHTNAYLLDGNVADACGLAAQQRETDSDAYWLRMTAFCKAIEGNRAAVDFELGILEEVTEIQPTFYQLIDKVLIEAEQQTGGGAVQRVDLSAPLYIDLLEATMARLAGVGVGELALDNVNPLAVKAILRNPNVAANAKAGLMGLAVREGWATGGLYAQFARTYAVTPDEIQIAQQLEQEDPQFSIDAVLGNLAGDTQKPEERLNALQVAWERAIRQKYASVAGGGLVDLSADYAPNSDSLELVAILSRAAVIAGDNETAQNWYRAVRAQAADKNSDADALLLELAPLMALTSGEMLDASLLRNWWQVQTEQDNRFAKANLLFTVAEALGNTVPEDLWQHLEEGPVAYAGQTVSPALWRKFLITAQDGDSPKTLALMYRLLSEGGPSSVPLSLAGSIIGTLEAVGLGAEARLLATEMLIAQGL